MSAGLSATPDELDAIEARLDAATPGPWVVRAWDREECWPGEEGRNRYVCSGEIIDRRFHVKGGHVATVEWHVDGSEVADADFIAAAPGDLRLLLDAVREQREIIGDLIGSGAPTDIVTWQASIARARACGSTERTEQ